VPCSNQLSYPALRLSHEIYNALAPPPLESTELCPREIAGIVMGDPFPLRREAPVHRRLLLTLAAVALAAACSASGSKSPTEELIDPADTLEGSRVLQMLAVQSATVGGCPQNIQAGLTLDDVAKTGFAGTFHTSTMVCSGPPVDTLLVASGAVTNARSRRTRSSSLLATARLSGGRVMAGGKGA
jgi:hypothetical protein